MSAIENVMKRWGFVRLSKYGLILTPEGRIMSLRPDVLDDGQGGKIVGWRDRDLAAAELARFEAPAVTRAVAIPVAITPSKAIRVSPPVAASSISPLIPAPVRPVAPPIPVAAARVAAPVAMNVAPLAQPEEDEWEWEIALARARAAAEEVEASMMPPVRPSRRTRLDTVPPPPAFIPARTELGVAPANKPKFVEAKTQPMASVATPRDQVISAGEWPKTEPLGNIDYDDRTNPMSEVVRVVRLHQAATPVAKIPAKPTPHPRTFVRAPSPVTVIPIPRLPRVDGRSLEPVVRTRFPQATPAPTRSERTLGISPPPPIRPADDDRTSPGMMAVPQAAQVVALPRIPSIVKRAR